MSHQGSAIKDVASRDLFSSACYVVSMTIRNKADAFIGAQEYKLLARPNYPSMRILAMRGDAMLRGYIVEQCIGRWPATMQTLSPEHVQKTVERCTANSTLRGFILFLCKNNHGLGGDFTEPDHYPLEKVDSFVSSDRLLGTFTEAIIGLCFEHPDLHIPLLEAIYRYGEIGEASIRSQIQSSRPQIHGVNDYEFDLPEGDDDTESYSRSIMIE